MPGRIPKLPEGSFGMPMGSKKDQSLLRRRPLRVLYEEPFALWSFLRKESLASIRGEHFESPSAMFSCSDNGRRNRIALDETLPLYGVTINIVCAMCASTILSAYFDCDMCSGAHSLALTRVSLPMRCGLIVRERYHVTIGLYRWRKGCFA